MRRKRDCIGCLALIEQDDKVGSWKAGCKLGYKSEVRDAGYMYPVPVPLEICPKPRTPKEYRPVAKRMSDKKQIEMTATLIREIVNERCIVMRGTHGSVFDSHCEGLVQVLATKIVSWDAR